MPYIAYFLFEALAFWGVSRLVGVGWALAGLFILMVVGVLGASSAFRGEMRRASAGTATLGQFAGGTALIMAGSALAVVPGYVTSFFGLLLLFPPTRELIRRSAATSMKKRIEDFGVQVYDLSPMSQRSTSYGSFTGTVIDAEPEQTDRPDVKDVEADIERWSRNARPEDFGDDK